MAEGSAAVPSTELLEWPKKDKRRLLHAVYRVGDLQRTIKFYTECFGMKLLRQRDIPEEKYSNAFLGFGSEESHFVVELTYNYGVTSYDIGTGFGHFAIATPDVYKMVEDIRAKGGNITREPGPVKGGSSVIAFVKDPDGYLFEIIQRASTPEPLCQVMLRVGDLDRAVKFYEKALGMKMVKKIDRPEYKYSIAMMGYAEEHETIVLELTYNYGVTEYTKGNAYAQVAIGTDDVYKSGEVVEHVIQELGGKVTRKPGPIPGLNTKITSFIDPDGWKTDKVTRRMIGSAKQAGGFFFLQNGDNTIISSNVDLKLFFAGSDAEEHTSIFLQFPMKQRTFSRHAPIVISEDKEEDDFEEVGEPDYAPMVLESTHSIKTKGTPRMSVEDIKRMASKRKNHFPVHFITNATPSLPRKAAKFTLTVIPKVEGSSIARVDIEKILIPAPRRQLSIFSLVQVCNEGSSFLLHVSTSIYLFPIFVKWLVSMRD